MDTMAIAEQSVSVANTELGSQINVKLMDKANDTAKEQASAMLDVITQSVNTPGVGSNIDISA